MGSGQRAKLFPFLDELNQATTIAKLTSEGVDDGTWTVLAKAMIVSGAESTDYTTELLSNLVTLWHEDIAGVIATKGPFVITGMLVG